MRPLRIKVLRQSMGWTQAELAKLCGRRSKSTISNWEAGHKDPPSKLLPKLAELFAVTIDELYEAA